MAGSGEEYVIARQRKIERKKRILTVAAVISLVGSTAFSMVPLLQQASQPAKPKPVSTEAILQQQAQGYELVLQREPNNQVALEKLAIAKLHLKDAQGAIALLEKLVKLHPERQDYKSALEQAKKQQGKNN